MPSSFSHLPCTDTGYFSPIIEAYLRQDSCLHPFYRHPVSAEGATAAIRAREQAPVDRALLCSVLRGQYAGLPVPDAVARNIDRLADSRTFTVCTAHQPALFTGSLFFVYKILHAVRLAERLAQDHPDKHFVPVFYMGSEDADLQELGQITLEGQSLVWEADQQGAVGRMRPRGLEKLIDRIDGQLSVHPRGSELAGLLREAYLDSPDIQTATLKLINRLFGEYGVVVLIPDQPDLKRAMIPVFEDELLHQPSAARAGETIGALSKLFKVQAHPREINLFYLHGDRRERLEKSGDVWQVRNTDWRFDEAGIRRELQEHPERFSPNVILRGIMQERILPNVAFIGGGGELAYWLELGGVFGHFQTPFPLLVLRNSLLLLEPVDEQAMQALGLGEQELFLGRHEQLRLIVRRASEHRLDLSPEKTTLEKTYAGLESLAAAVDGSLKGHIGALQARAMKSLEALEKKLIRAEKKRLSARERQLERLRARLFPGDQLQERVETCLPYYARYGPDFFRAVHRHAFSLEQRFGILRIREAG